MDRLKRWQRAGLVPRPKQVHVRGHSGSASLYPAGTLRQVLELCRRQAEERRLHELRLDLWWDGFWVEPAQLRESLRAEIDDPLAEIRNLRAEVRDPSEAALTLVEAARSGRMTSPIARLLRDRTGSEANLRTAAVAVLTVAFGGDPVWESEDVGLQELEPHPHSLVALLLGFERPSRLIPDPPSVREELSRLRDVGLLDLEHPGRLLVEATESELEAARLRAHAHAGLGDFSRALEVTHGGDVAGLGVFVAAERRDVRWFRAWLLRTDLLLARLEERDSLDEVTRAVGANRRKAEAVVTIASAFPGYKSFLGPEGTRRLEALPVEEQEVVRHNLCALLDQKPELKAALGLEER